MRRADNVLIQEITITIRYIQGVSELLVLLILENYKQLCILSLLMVLNLHVSLAFIGINVWIFNVSERNYTIFRKRFQKWLF